MDIYFGYTSNKLERWGEIHSISSMTLENPD